MKNLQNVMILLAHYLETIQVEHLKIAVVSFLLVYNVCTKFGRNLRHASVFRVDLTRNDPYRMQCKWIRGGGGGVGD